MAGSGPIAGGVATGGSSETGGAGAEGGASAGGAGGGTCSRSPNGYASTDVSTYCGAHCSPGIYTPYPYLEVMSNCGNYAFVPGGIQDDMPGLLFSIRDITLEAAMRPAETYAFSIENRHPITQLEFWGANTACGPSLELLWSGPQDKETIACFEFVPSAAYTHLLMVWKGGGEHYGISRCARGSCSNAVP